MLDVYSIYEEKNMEKEDLLLQKRFSELANRAFTQNMFTFTEFLSLPELDLFYKNEYEKECVYTCIN